MRHYQLCAPVSDLSSLGGELETQLLFGERLLYKGPKYYAYSQLINDEDIWRPYPVNHISSKTSFSQLSQYVQPNAAIKSFNAFLEPWHIPLPYGSPLSIDSQGHVYFPEEVQSRMGIPFEHESLFCDLSHVRFFDEPFSMDLLLKESENFIGLPYLWGGRCVHHSLIDYGVDCSGFLNVLFQAHGLSIPRNARDQYKDCDFVDSLEDLPIGGFVFLQNDGESRISHIMLKKSESCLIHAIQTLGRVVYCFLGKDGEFVNNRFYFPHKQGRAFYGIPKRRKVFF
ncbi:C40 family peptidase [Chlamydia vaughanii]|uniref:C40 family peptidase n=1 Tax=Chlamydia vaughanii TaxID=3112552 RepID=UPI0032B199EC